MRSVCAATALLLLVAACGDDAAISDEYQSFRDQPTACGAEPPPPPTPMAFDEPDDMGLTGRVTAVLHTSCGDIEIELLTDIAPRTVNSFVFLAKQGYFDGTVSHRIIRGGFFQAGDPTASGFGGPGYVIPDELPPPGVTYTKGAVSMANAGPGTAGSQFFVALGNLDLPPTFTIFGQVVGSRGTLEALHFLRLGPRPDSDETSYPLETLYIDSVTIER